MKGVAFRKLYDLYVLKPVYWIFIILGIFYFYYRDWISGIFFVIMWFLIGGIGGKLYPEMSPKELAQGTVPSKEEITSTKKEEISYQDIYLTVKASRKLSVLIGLSTLIILWHSDLQWYLVIIFGVLAGYIFSFLNYLIITFISKRFKK